MLENNKKRKKHNRRAAYEVEKAFTCPYDDCNKFFGSDGSINLHIKLKHKGGTKTEREDAAKIIVHAYAEAVNKNGINASNVVIDPKILDQIGICIPPGIIIQTARKSKLFSTEKLA